MQSTVTTEESNTVSVVGSVGPDWEVNGVFETASFHVNFRAGYSYTRGEATAKIDSEQHAHTDPCAACSWSPASG